MAYIVHFNHLTAEIKADNSNNFLLKFVANGGSVR